ncbi:MAG: hypothetical protein HY911_13345 [Desulfobacterales bacterium]|nr:hypothetical protein [Desulfobacterales bacterium]
MNPKKPIIRFLSETASNQPEALSSYLCQKVLRLQEGMSAATATLVIREAINEKYKKDCPVEDLVNNGRYYTANIVDYEGKTIEKLLVDKQTGGVSFL